MPRKRLLDRLGPGLLYAAGAVGVSHLVQATRAGGDYGLALIGIIVVVAIVKYPGIRFGGDYSIATGKTLLHSYASLGKAVPVIYAAIIVVTMAFVTAAVVLVVNGLATALLGIEASDVLVGSVVLLLTGLLLVTGKYRLLERLNKLIVPCFTVLSLLVAAVLASRADFTAMPMRLPPLDAALLMYVVQLAGWMLTPMDGSVLQSLWTAAKTRELGSEFTAADSRFDFNLGYATSLVLALCFVIMGAAVLYGRGIETAPGSTAFATQLIGLFAAAIGSWSFPVVGVLALLVMYSTLLTVLDGFARNLDTLADIGLPGRIARRYEYSIALIVLAAVAVLGLFMRSFTTFIDFAGMLTFLLAPFYASLNHRAMFGGDVPPANQPGRLLWCWSWLGIIVMSAVAVSYVYLRWL